jgi:hypothetical protein
VFSFNIILRKFSFLINIYLLKINLLLYTMSVTTTTTTVLPNKYPFIQKFVDAMESVNAHEYVTSNETDLKSLFVFFKLYVNVCRNMKTEGVPLTNENIGVYMTHEFESNRGNLINVLTEPVTLLEDSKLLLLPNEQK